MQIPLKRHSASSSQGVEEIYVDLQYSESKLLDLRYVVHGELDRIVMPPPIEPRRGDRLWETTCFELFLKEAAGSAYHELNFSPSGEWAAYAFQSYREGMRATDLLLPPIISCTTTPWGALEVHASVPLDSFMIAKPVSLNLTAIVEEKGSERSFWALSHPPGEPDFHDPSCFLLELPAPERP